VIKFIQHLKNRLFFPLAHKVDLDQLYRQIEGLIQIQNVMQGLPALRPMRGWAISPDAMNIILARLQSISSPTVIEFGAGQSTVILAAFLKRTEGRLITVEHDPGYLQQIQIQLKHCELLDRVEFINAKLTGMGNAQLGKSYDLSSLPHLFVDLALVDGPPTSIGVNARLNPLDWSARHLISGGSIFLDDSNRLEEQTCKHRLLEIHPTLKLVEHQAEKGLLEFIAP